MRGEEGKKKEGKREEGEEGERGIDEGVPFVSLPSPRTNKAGAVAGSSGGGS